MEQIMSYISRNFQLQYYTFFKRKAKCVNNMNGNNYKFRSPFEGYFKKPDRNVYTGVDDYFFTGSNKKWFLGLLENMTLKLHFKIKVVLYLHF